MCLRVFALWQLTNPEKSKHYMILRVMRLACRDVLSIHNLLYFITWHSSPWLGLSLHAFKQALMALYLRVITWIWPKTLWPRVVLNMTTVNSKPWSMYVFTIYNVTAGFNSHSQSLCDLHRFKSAGGKWRHLLCVFLTLPHYLFLTFWSFLECEASAGAFEARC